MINGCQSWVEVNVQRLRENAQAIGRALGDTQMIAVIKANAYGHGCDAVATALASAGVNCFAVAYTEEAAIVRASVPEASLILVLGVVGAADVPQLLRDRVVPVVVSLAQAQALSAASQAMGVILPVHFKLDTGMGRLGFVCPSEVVQAVEAAKLPGLDVQGVCTHFSMVEPQKKPGALRRQVEKFRQAVELIEASVGRRLFRHMSSSRAALLLPECDQSAVRVGISLYGYGAGELGRRFVTAPVLSWKARVLQVKTVPAGFAVGYYESYKTATATDIATLGCGYADGYQRHLGNKGHVLIGGRRCPVVGRVSMNWISVDLGPNSGVRSGDEAVLIGTQGNEAIWADELATHCQTIAYEVLTGISRHIERRIVGD